MEGTLTCVRGGEQYGRNIYAVGDVNHDGLQDWIVGHIRCDSLMTINGTLYTAEEILLYKGVRGGVPRVESGERIGVNEYGARTDFLASGDWDGDGNVDIACRVQIYGDTSYGNVEGYSTSSLLVFWGNVSGHYSIDDTSHLYGGANQWLSICKSLCSDFDQDGIDDLLVWGCGGKGFEHGSQLRDIARLQLFRGHDHQRWGKEGVESISSWGKWGLPPCSNLALLDHDGDGNVDIVLYDNPNSGLYAGVSVLYGNTHGLPDTNDLQTIDLSAAPGYAVLLADVTGDGIPELQAFTGLSEQSNSVKVYIGLKGQRLIEQFGGGNDAPQPDSVRWWGRPWADIVLPHRIDQRWFMSQRALLDYGDGNLDGVGDIWAYSWPYLLCYTSGGRLDSLVDGILDTRPAIQPGANAVLGDIDGTGRRVLAFGDGNAVVFFSGSRDVPSDGRSRRLPEGTGPMVGSVAPDALQSDDSLILTVVPNPVRGEINLHWNGGERAAGTITISDMTGRELRRIAVAAGDHQASLQAADLPAGSYFMTIIINHQAATTTVLLR